MIKILTVSEINTYVKRVFDNDYILKNSSIKGEISNLKIHSSGHMYFSLKDEFSKISAVMFKSQCENLNFTPINGMKVVLQGRISIYQKDGSYQIYVENMKTEGVGELHISFEKLKNKLLKEGLFSDEYKKEIPKYPKKVAVITSKTGAAVRDIINVARRRNPNIDIMVVETFVQGIYAKDTIKDAIKKVNKIKNIDVIIIARGGGSIEELWAFNEEIVAREIFKSKIPIVTGIGHETDFTISDFVSDFRAPTPSSAAEIVFPTLKEIKKEIDYLKTLSNRYILDRIYSERQNITSKKNILDGYSPRNITAHQLLILDNYIERLKNTFKIRREKEKNSLFHFKNLLEAHNPKKILKKGYAILENEDGRVIKEKEMLLNSKKIKVTLSDGESNIIIK